MQEAVTPEETLKCGAPMLLSKEAVEVLQTIPECQFFFGPNFKGFREPGGLDLFSGNYGVARQMCSLGCPWGGNIRMEQKCRRRSSTR